MIVLTCRYQPSNETVVESLPIFHQSFLHSRGGWFLALCQSSWQNTCVHRTGQKFIKVEHIIIMLITAKGHVIVQGFRANISIDTLGKIVVHHCLCCHPSKKQGIPEDKFYIVLALHRREVHGPSLMQQALIGHEGGQGHQIYC